MPATPADPIDPDADPDAEKVAVAREISLRLLETRPRTRHELATALGRRRVPPDVAAAVLDRLGEVGLVDDAAFATAWVDSRHAGRGLGRRALAGELRRKGVDRAVADAALGAITLDDEIAAARDLVARRMRSMPARLDEAARARRLIGLLARRGIPSGVAQRVVREALGADGVDESEPVIE